jgi:(2Fe-2S) ferredoxin
VRLCATNHIPGVDRLPPNNPEPAMEPYSRHVLVCTGAFCSPEQRGQDLYRRLPILLQREGLLFGPGRVKRGETPCLGVCAGGPIVVVYPDGVWYGGVTPMLLERIVVDHLKSGSEVSRAVFHRLADRLSTDVADDAGPSQLELMADDILYHRPLPHGPVVRIRRTSEAGVLPVTAVLEVDRRAGTPREGIGNPPPLMHAEAMSEAEVVAKLEPHAKDDRMIAALLRDKGLH